MSHIIEIRDGGIVTHSPVDNPDDYDFVGEVEVYDDADQFRARVRELS